MPTRFKGTDASVFSLGETDYIGDVENFKIGGDVKTKESKGVADIDDFPTDVGHSTTVTFSMMVGSAPALFFLLGSSIACTFNTGKATYTGTFLVSKVDHSVKREDLQMQDCTLMSQGIIAVAQ